jgi:hypothetical protein
MTGRPFSLVFIGTISFRIMGGANRGKVDYDEILQHIGQFGPWQRRIHLLMWLTSAAGGLAVVVYTFTAFSADYRCRNPYCEENGGNPEYNVSGKEQWM